MKPAESMTITDSKSRCKFTINKQTGTSTIFNFQPTLEVNLMKIGIKIGAGFGVVIALLAIISIIGISQLNSVTGGFEDDVLYTVQNEMSAVQIPEYLLQVRRSEKDFLARQEMKYAERVNDFLDKAEAEVIELESLTTRSESKSELKEIQTGIRNYRQAFEKMVTASVQRGLNEKEGAQGDFRAAAHEIDSFLNGRNLNALEILYLTLRKHEKDYMLRDNKDYIQKADNVLEEMKSTVQSSSLSRSDRDNIVNLLNSYRQSFNLLVQKNDEIKNYLSTMKNSADRGMELADSVAELEAATYAKMVETISAGAHKSISTLWIFAILAVIIGVTAAISITLMISRPVGKITDLAKLIAVGDLSQEISISQKDEIGELADAFRDMTESLKTKAEAAEQIAKGNFNVSIEAASSEDTLGNAMTAMRNNLKESAEAIQGAMADAQLKVSYLDALSMPIHVVDKEMNITYINPIMAQVLGMPPEQIIGRKCYDLLRNPHCQTDKCATAKSMREGKTVTSETIVSPQGTPIPIQYSGAPIRDIEGNIIGAAEQAVDISNIKKVINEINATAGALNNGDLNVRAEVADAEGDYKLLVDGFNQSIDSMTQPMEETIRCLGAMAGGNLTEGMQNDYKGDLARMKNALNATLKSLNETLGQVNISVDQVASGSQQVADSSQSLSQGATEQASSLEEVSSTMVEQAAQTKQNAENAVQANTLSTAARQAAEKGNQSMDQMLEAMREINDSSGNISKIIKVIDEIAFQTNLLALNAAVEAARAGVHGKGFAVVAEEVRNLAQRSAQAAKETTELIEGSIKRVENGTGIANETASALEGIVSSITKATDLVAEIASASKEQAEGIEQINESLGQIDQVTQSNTANAEESAAAAEELSGQSTQLKQMIARFRILDQSDNDAGQATALAAGTRHPRNDNDGNGRGRGQLRGSADNRTKVVRPEEVISLDDDEFGSF